MLTIVNSAAMNTEEHMSFGIVAFLAFSGSGIVGSYSRSILSFFFLHIFFNFILFLNFT